MKIICDKTLLSAAIDGVSRAVTPRSTTPALEGILLKAEGFNLTLTGYDMELGIVTDERIANGHYYGRCFKELNRYYKDPHILETKPETIVRDPDVRVANPKFIVK